MEEDLYQHSMGNTNTIANNINANNIGQNSVRDLNMRSGGGVATGEEGVARPSLRARLGSNWKSQLSQNSTANGTGQK